MHASVVVERSALAWAAGPGGSGGRARQALQRQARFAFLGRLLWIGDGEMGVFTELHQDGPGAIGKGSGRGEVWADT